MVPKHKKRPPITTMVSLCLDVINWLDVSNKRAEKILLCKNKKIFFFIFIVIYKRLARDLMLSYNLKLLPSFATQVAGLYQENYLFSSLN